MKTDTKFAAAISAGMIILGIFLFIWMLPFLYMYIGIIEQGKTNAKNTKWDKLAVKYSVFKGQKVHTIPSAILTFSLTKDYDTVIEYSKELEQIGEFQKSDAYFLTKAYIEKGDYDNALKYAKLGSNKLQEVQIYIKSKDFAKAKTLVNDMLSKTPVKPTVYLYKSEIEVSENNLKDALCSVDKLLAINPSHMEALRLKAKILKHSGKTNEYKQYQQKIREREAAFRNRVKF